VLDPDVYVFDPADYETRHPGTVALLRWFEFDHLKAKPFDISVSCWQLAHHMVRELPDGAELTAGLRKLLEAKDCFVRAAVDA
jgi:hypothetical protein